MAEFKISFDKLMRWEGYVLEHVPGDRGALTCCGISRVYNPHWKGWEIIDEAERAGIAISIDELKTYIHEFYEHEYAPLEKIPSQKIADQIFQAYINCGNIAKKWAQKVCNGEGRSNLTIDGIIGFNTLSALHEITELEFIPAFYEMQIAYYDAIIKRDPSQSKFRSGWYKRASDFL